MACIVTPTVSLAIRTLTAKHPRACAQEKQLLQYVG